MIKRIQKLLEKFAGYVEDSSMETTDLTPVEFNPSYYELNKLLSKYKTLRALTDYDELEDIYVWDSNGAYHDEVMDDLGIGSNYYKGLVYKDSYSNQMTWVLDIYQYDYSNEQEGKKYLKEYRDKILKSPLLSRYKIEAVAITPRVILNINSTHEEYFNSTVSWEGELIEIFKNPSFSEIHKIWKKYRAVRFIVDYKKNVYAFDGLKAMHSDVYDNFNIEWDYLGVLEEDGTMIIDAEYFSYEEYRDEKGIVTEEGKKEIKKIVLNNSIIRGWRIPEEDIKVLDNVF